jgi:phosphatidylglycerophosphatase A
VRRSFPVAIASAGFVGFFPIAPGTAGSVVGLAVWWALRSAGAGVLVELGVVGLLVVVGAWAATSSERALGITDPGPVVIDEVMGMCLTMIAAPLSWPAALLGFVLFRAFDITKPPPARQLERLHGGWGIMLDDFAAGLYAWVALRVCVWMVPTWTM